LQREDLDARWTKKNGISYYGYKNSICIDVDQGFVSRYAVNVANIHESKMLPHLLDPEKSMTMSGQTQHIPVKALRTF
jgi:hypothetical protein